MASLGGSALNVNANTLKVWVLKIALGSKNYFLSSEKWLTISKLAFHYSGVNVGSTITIII